MYLLIINPSIYLYENLFWNFWSFRVNKRRIFSSGLQNAIILPHFPSLLTFLPTCLYSVSTSVLCNETCTLVAEKSSRLWQSLKGNQQRNEINQQSLLFDKRRIKQVSYQTGSSVQNLCRRRCRPLSSNVHHMRPDECIAVIPHLSASFPPSVCVSQLDRLQATQKCDHKESLRHLPASCGLWQQRESNWISVSESSPNASWRDWMIKVTMKRQELRLPSESRRELKRLDICSPR